MLTLVTQGAQESEKNFVPDAIRYSLVVQWTLSHRVTSPAAIQSLESLHNHVHL